MAKANSYGLMVLYTKDNLLIIESQEKVYINGLMAAVIKEK
jgi:hypothetical protein